MKRDHHLETAALAAVVRWAVDELAGRHQKQLPDAALQGLATVERFVAGEEVTFAELDKAREVYDLKCADRGTQWVLAAIGNLGFFASKARGWQGGDASVMDAATYALSSARNDKSEPWTELKEIRSAALASAKPSAKTTKAAPKGAPALQRVTTELAEVLGPAAHKKLSTAEGAFDPKHKGGEAALGKLLKKYGLPTSAALLAFDTRYGGLVFSEDGTDWLVGAHACLASKAHAIDKGSKLVPVAYSPNDVIFYLDKEGAAFARDTIEDEAPTKFADNGDEMMRKILNSL